MNDKIKTALQGILEKFKSGDIPEVIAISTFPIPRIPSAKWSLINRMLMFIGGTKDARGFHQWRRVNRRVKKGAKAITIFAPRIVRQKKGEEENLILKGFLAVPVFRVEDTEGEPLDKTPMELPELPLQEVAQRWGIALKPAARTSRYYGCYYQMRNEIVLATKEESVFFHELSHVAHRRIIGELKEEQDPLQEIVAELSAQALCHIVGKTSRYLGNSYRYIGHYAEKLAMSPLTACVEVLAEVEKVLALILGQAENSAALPEAR